jgi:archaemetzincin
MEKILLVILCRIDADLLVALKQRLESVFNKIVEIRYHTQKLDFAYDPKRKQYVSPRLICRLRRIKKHTGDMVLGVTDVDLYSPGYDFVFGEAEMASGVATLSLFRLKGSRRSNNASPEVFRERAVREAVHELGHLYQMIHCSEPKCVMHTCPYIADVDKAKELCDQCERLLERNLNKAMAVA